MAHMPVDDVQALWNNTPQRNWQGLNKTLRQHKGKVDGISDNLIDLLIPITQRLGEGGLPYPDSVQKLYEVINRELRAGGELKERHA